MPKNKITFPVLIVTAVVVLASACAGRQPDERTFREPPIDLEHVEIAYFTGFYYFSSDVKPTRGQADNYGAPMLLVFVYKINNPNPYAVMLENFSFDVLFEDFKVNHVISSEAMWIPAAKANRLRVPAMFDARQTLSALILPEAIKLANKKISPWDVLEKWWTGAADFSYPISVTDGAAVFRVDGVIRAVAFAAVYPN